MKSELARLIKYYVATFDRKHDATRHATLFGRTRKSSLRTSGPFSAASKELAWDALENLEAKNIRTPLNPGRATGPIYLTFSASCSKKNDDLHDECHRKSKRKNQKVYQGEDVLPRRCPYFEVRLSRIKRDYPKMDFPGQKLEFGGEPIY